MDTIHKRLELLRRINCLGQTDIEKAFEGDGMLPHLLHRYEKCRTEHGTHGNFEFIFRLDEDYARRLLDKIGYHNVKLGEKFTPEQKLLSPSDLGLLVEVIRGHVEMGEENAKDGPQLDAIYNKIADL